MSAKQIFLLLFLILGFTSLYASTGRLKPRIVVLTDIAPANIEPDDMESMVRLMTYADQLEIEALITSVGWNRNPYLPQWADSLHRVIDAYEKDVANLMRRSSQHSFVSLKKEQQRQRIGYWPSPNYLRSRVAMGSLAMGIAKVGKDNDSPGSNLIIRLVDEDDPRPLWITCWGGGNTLAQAIWRVKQERSPEEVRKFLRKLRVYTITDQDRYNEQSPTFSSHYWMRNEFKDDLLFIWDESAWLTQNELGSRNWDAYARFIQGKGNLGKTYPKYRWGVEGDTPSFLNVMPNGLHNPDQPGQIGWAGCFEKSLCGDSVTTCWNNWHQPQKGISRRYEEHFYPAIFNDFAARMEWAQTGEGNHNPVVIVNGKKGLSSIEIKAQPGKTVELDASRSYDPDNHQISFRWWVQDDAGVCPEGVFVVERGAHASIQLPTLDSQMEIHIVCEVTDKALIPLTSYRRVIIRNR